MPAYDISRIAFDPRKHYSSVRMQQGRVLTDDDWNENERIDAEERRRSRADIIGPFGSPDNGFRVRNLAVAGNGTFDFDIDAGTLHLGGNRLELDARETFQTQRDWIRQAAADRTAPTPANLAVGQERFDMVYLEAWQQPVCAVEDDALLEAALGGPDTTTRLRTTRRVRIGVNVGSDDCPEAWATLRQQWQTQGLGRVNARYERIPTATLTVGFAGAGLPDDLCTPTAAGGYLGADNQAIRVELTAPNRFTWGFDNAAPIYRVQVSASGNGFDTLTMLTLPADVHHWPVAGQVVEVLPWAEVLPNQRKTADRRGHFAKVSGSYNPDTQQLTLDTPLDPNFGSEWKTRPDAAQISTPAPGEFLCLRVWQRGDDLTSPAQLPFVAGTSVPLGNTGLTVTFGGSDFVTNDHWVIAARPETPTQVVPWELTTGMPPVGIRRYVAPLAIIRWVNRGGRVLGEVIHDCRKKFRPLTDPDCCCTYSVGDGVRSFGDYDNMQEAIDNLPPQGGKICVLPGIHQAAALIRNRRQIQISGCGDQTIVWDVPERGRRPIFTIQHSQRITIERLTLATLDGIAIAVVDSSEKEQASAEITVQHNRITACLHAVLIELNPQQAGNNQIKIEHNQIGMLDKPEGLAAIFTLADDVLIERNRIVLVPAPDEDDPRNPRDPADPKDPRDPCFDLNKFREDRKQQRAFLAKLFAYVRDFTAAKLPDKLYQAQGGIQVGGSSENVQIRRNEIVGGWGCGVMLGHVPEQEPPRSINDRYTRGRLEEASERAFLSTIYDLLVDDNDIRQMGLAGIGVVAIFSRENLRLAVRVEGFVFSQNRIEQCAWFDLANVPDDLRDDVAIGGIVLTHALDGQIRDNRIERNGPTAMRPVCGVYIAFGQKIGLSDNQILNNGPWVDDEQLALQRGNRGGIVVKMALKLAFQSLKADKPSDDSLPALWVHDNVVTQPLGHALYVVAMGPVSVSDNYFTSQGIDTTNLFSFLAGSVFILNLGLSKDLILFLLKVLSKQQDPKSAENALQNKAVMDLLRAVQYMPSGKVMFSGNQTTLDIRSDARSSAISSQLIASLDDVAFVGNQSECEALLYRYVEEEKLMSGAGGGLTFDIVVVNTLLLAASVRANDNRFTDGLTFALYSLLSLGLINTATGNQATHCLLVLGAEVAENSNIVLLDDRCNDDKDRLGKMVAGKTF